VKWGNDCVEPELHKENRMPNVKYYVVWKGRKPGIYGSWEACALQVNGFTGAEYKAFTNRSAAEAAFESQYAKFAGKPSSNRQWLFSPEPPISESYCVDAACSGSPGPLEYQCVHTNSGKLIFKQGPFENGTNNVGEFLAIVHALELLDRKGIGAPVYSDSGTAIGWVKKKKCNTTLIADYKNARLFELISHAERWLSGHKNSNPVLKWDTRAWGEIPADFNRK
jgi:ribonuclease HI